MSQDSPTQFGSITKLLHWTIAFLIIAQFYIIYTRWTFAEGDIRNMQYMTLHKAIGVSVLILGILFITWRATHVRPAFPVTMRPWEKVLARTTHYFLFFVMLAMPVSGYVMSVAGGHPVSWFGLFQLPSLLATDKALSHTFAVIHRFISYGVIAFVILHTLGALKHHFIDKDNVLKRMLPGGNP